MPNIRIMNWNIEQFSENKILIPGMCQAIARTVISQNIDLLIIVELRRTNVANVMNILCTALNGFFPGGNNYKVWCISYSTGTEHYGFIIKNLDILRPVRVATVSPMAPTEAGHIPGAPHLPGSASTPLEYLDYYQFTTWPHNLPVTAYPPGPGMGPWRGPDLPLTEVFSSPPRTRDRRQNRFFGQRPPRGRSQGMGFRLPCLAMFRVAGGPVIAVVVTHSTAARSTAGRQLRQFKDLHISQKFNQGGFVDLDGIAVAVQEILFTGDFNVDFQNVNPHGTPAQRGNAGAYGALTPALPHTGSDLMPQPPMLPGYVGPPLPAPPPVLATPPPALPPPMVPFPPPPGLPPNERWQVPEEARQIQMLALRTAVTIERTHLIGYNPGLPPVLLANLRDTGFDNFFFGGNALTMFVQIPCPAGIPMPGLPVPMHDAGLTVDIPNNIRQFGDPALAGVPAGPTPVNGLLNVQGAYGHHMMPPPTKNANHAPNLGAPYVPMALTLGDQLIGARFISDHLPMVIQFNFP